MSVVLFAAVAKFIDLGAFAADLQEWTLLPRWSLPLVTVLVPSAEFVVSMSWLVGLARRSAATALLFLLAGLTLAYALQAWVARPPSCACFGKILAFRSSAHQSQWVVLVDVALLSIASLGFGLIERSTPRPSKLGVRRSANDGAAVARGFSLVEIILVVALVGVLLALSAPSVSGIRARAQDMQSLANLRTHVQVFSLYGLDWQDRFPFFADPVRPVTPITNSWRNHTVTVPYFLSYFLWPVALAEPYYSGDDQSEVFFHPAAGRWRAEIDDVVFPSPYSYGCCFIAVPDYWNATTRRRGFGQLRATLMSQVTFPRAKVLLSEPYPALQLTTARGGSQAYMGLGNVDGSAHRLLYSKLLQGGLGDSRGLDARMGHTSPFPAPLHTLDGVHGRDVP